MHGFLVHSCAYMTGFKCVQTYLNEESEFPLFNKGYILIDDSYTAMAQSSGSQTVFLLPSPMGMLLSIWESLVWFL